MSGGPLKQELVSKFKPKMPASWKRKPQEWLTTDDIRRVMKQYDIKYKDFVFIGPVPIDFDHKYDRIGNCIVNELCSLHVRDLLKKQIARIGIIFNTDPHTMSGEHWIALFADFHKGIYFFDSYGVKPPKEVDRLMKKLQAQCHKLGNKIQLYYNDKRHQFKNSECGVYSMHFIIKLLEGEPFKKVITTVIKDDEMHKYRYIYYRDE